MQVRFLPASLTCPSFGGFGVATLQFLAKNTNAKVTEAFKPCPTQAGLMADVDAKIASADVVFFDQAT